MIKMENGDVVWNEMGCTHILAIMIHIIDFFGMVSLSTLNVRMNLACATMFLFHMLLCCVCPFHSCSRSLSFLCHFLDELNSMHMKLLFLLHYAVAQLLWHRYAYIHSFYVHVINILLAENFNSKSIVLFGECSKTCTHTHKHTHVNMQVKYTTV